MAIAAFWLGQAPAWNEIVGAGVIVGAVCAASLEETSEATT